MVGCWFKINYIVESLSTYHGLEGDVAVFLERGLALLLRGRPVVGDVGHVALFLVAVVTLDGAVVDRLLHLNNKSDDISKHLDNFLWLSRAFYELRKRAAISTEKSRNFGKKSKQTFFVFSKQRILILSSSSPWSEWCIVIMIPTISDFRYVVLLSRKLSCLAGASFVASSAVSCVFQGNFMP